MIFGSIRTNMVLTSLFHVMVTMLMAQNPTPDCDYYQYLQPGTTYYIYNKQYPSYYPANTACRWIAEAPVGYQVQLNCTDILITESPNCQQDRMVVSKTGSNSFLDGHNYCGTGQLQLLSDSNRMSVGLFSVYNSLGGKMSCNIYAVQSTSTCDCGWRQQRRIVGGTETKPNEYPFTCALIDLEKRSLYCGATLISDRYAITAAHCIWNRYAPNVGLLVGEHDITTGQDTDYTAMYVLESYVVHEGYSTVTNQNDIAIVKTQVKMAMSMSVGPACLPIRFSSSNFVGSSVTVLGWGTTEFTGPQSKVLLAANLTCITNSECSTKLQPHEHIIYPTQLCTYMPGKDACQSDSGGPLVWRDPTTGRLHLVGVVSYGVSCASSVPGVNTRVTSYLQWIISKTSEVQYCVK